MLRILGISPLSLIDSSLLTNLRADGLTLDDLTVDHPQRRGCKACFEAGDDECTLIEHKFEYPCEACRYGSVECELIIPPELKKSCERCKQKRRSCSYVSDGGEGVETCDQCANEGVKCCAGPLKLSKTFDKSTSREIGVRPSVVDDEGKEVSRMWVACNQCRVLGKHCSLRGKDNLGPCSGCRKNHEQCKFVLPPKRQLQLSAAPDLSHPHRSKQPKIDHYFSRKRGEGPETLEEKNVRKSLGISSPATNTRNLLEEVAALSRLGRRALKKGMLHILRKTSFCHPIQFNYIPDPTGNHPCDWCLTPFFAFYGLAGHGGPRTVKGYWLEDGEGFEEVCGGFADPEVDGKARERTRMCVSCTFEVSLSLSFPSIPSPISLTQRSQADNFVKSHREYASSPVPFTTSVPSQTENKIPTSGMTQNGTMLPQPLKTATRLVALWF